jgi:serine/threonine protein kinase
MILKNRYQIKSKIGNGGFGSIFDAQDKLSDNQIVIKLVSNK